MHCSCLYDLLVIKSETHTHNLVLKKQIIMCFWLKFSKHKKTVEPRRLASLDQWFLNCSVATKFSYVPRTEQNLGSRGKLRQEEPGKVFRGRGS